MPFVGYVSLGHLAYLLVHVSFIISTSILVVTVVLPVMESDDDDESVHCEGSSHKLTFTWWGVTVYV